ncbi:hypothetical protein Clacol_003778 [Clathrus columnatus]|uniref:ABC transmembrane type-1 domain-containing protein n=1 Tax=Clathrus columnatus TaxID=1419009 RepID=A0AAV5A5I9_9AGAM|nr:hypothetical protein Clacol_003778 [Clathrus columnatus]
MTKYLGIDGETDNVFYKMSNLDDRIKNVDQMLTVDIQRFSNHLAAVYSNLAKPILDVVLYNYQLSQNVGAEGLILITVLIQASAALLRALTPPFGAYTAREAAMSGALRHSQSRLVEAADEVAFFSGEKTERMLIERDYIGLVKHVNYVLKMRLWHGTVEEGIIKWLWGSFGLGLCAIPVFFKVPGVNVSDLGSRTEGFVTNRRLLLSASDAVGRVMYSYKELSELAGYTARVSLLLDTITDVRGGVFNKTRIEGAHSDQRELILLNRGRILESDDIQFENVPIVTPNGDVLVRSLSFHIKPGVGNLCLRRHTSTKLSIAKPPHSWPERILGGLWPVYGEYHIIFGKPDISTYNTGGLVRKPPASDFILIPQRPYLCVGTLRDQIIYPHSKLEMEHRGITDDDLASVLAVVEMEQVVDREGGWDVVRDWRDALSGGDKQKIAWARLFYHCPKILCHSDMNLKYSVLDEATSHIPQDLEMRMMEHAMALGISLLTVSHRPSLWQYHSHILQYDGAGGYVFTTLNAKQRLALQEEKQGLETKLLGVPKIQARLENLRNALDERLS